MVEHLSNYIRHVVELSLIHIFRLYHHLWTAATVAVAATAPLIHIRTIHRMKLLLSFLKFYIIAYVNL